MPSIMAPAHILLTGGTGFIGSAILVDLLAQGFTVRATVRSLAKATPLETAFKPYVDSSKLTFAVVPDMTVEGAFIDAVQGIDAIIHTASPMPPKDPNTEPKLLIEPAVKGTVGLLVDAAKVPSIKRIVVTSSVATLLEPKEGPYVYSEADWFDTAVKLVEQYGVGAHSGLKYVASKILAERTAWEWVEKNKPSFDLVTVLPPWVWGKSFISSVDHFRSEASNHRLLFAIVRGNLGTLEDYHELTEFTDVADVSRGHIKALTVPEAAGQRLALRGGGVLWQDVFDILNANPVEGVSVTRGTVGSGKTFVVERYTTAEKANKLLGMTYRSTEDTLRETVAQAVELGWSPHDEIYKVSK